MCKETKRQRRRRDYLRMKERARKVQARWWDVHRADPDLDIASGQLANNLALCSCYMCGNPRKWWHELTLQEHKADFDEKEQHGDMINANI